MVLVVSPSWGGFGGEAFGEVFDHGKGDHSGRVAGSGFVVAGQPAVLHEPADGAFDDPASFDHAESFDGRVFRDDLDIDAEDSAVFNECVLEARVDPCLGQGRVDGGCLVEKIGPDRVVADAGCCDDDGEEQAEGVGDDSPFTAYDFLAGVGSLGGEGGRWWRSSRSGCP